MQELTERQREALLAYIDTGTVADAAEVMGISERTAKGHLEVVVRKLNADGVRGLVKAAIAAGIIRVEVA